MLDEHALFDDDAVDLSLLRRRAHNLRWATLPEGVIPLTAADPDFPAAPAIREAIRAYAEGGVFSYGPAEGLPEFRETVARTLTGRKGHPATADQIVPTDSAASAMYLAARLALQGGGEAIVFDPVDFLFASSVEAAGGRAIRCPVDPGDGSIDLDALGRLITPRTRMIGICNPHNPTGRVLRRDELEGIAALAEAHDLWILSDEIWSDVVYAPMRHVPTASLGARTAARTLTVHGFSKSFGLAGLRVGYLVAPDAETAQLLLSLSGARATAHGVSTLSQVAAVAAYDRCWDWQRAFLAHLTRMRDLAAARLDGMAGLKCHRPEGTFVLFPDARSLGMSSEALAGYLLAEARVAVVPGAARWFGPGAEGHLRICFSTSSRILTEALDRIEQALEKLRPPPPGR